jgi:RND family efflux transporter MFP subunit
MMVTFQKLEKMKYVVCLLLGLFAVSCGKPQGGLAEENGYVEGEHADHAEEVLLDSAAAAASGIRTEQVRQGVFAEVIRVGGRIMAAQGDERRMVAPTRGVVSFGAFRPAEGVSVKGREVALTLASSALEEGDVLVRTRAAYEKARRNYERAKMLVADRIVSEREYAEVEAAYETARTAYEAIAKASGENGVAVHWPVTGFVTGLYVREGDYVEAGTTLATVSANRKLTLRAEVPERFFGRLRDVRTAHFRTGYDGRVYRLEELGGRMVSYGRSAGTGAFHVPVTFEFENVGRDIVSGGYVEVWLLQEGGKASLSVPAEALIEEQGLFSVFVKTGTEEYVKRPVRTGGNNGAEVEIVAGLTAGDDVVTAGAYALKLASATGNIPAHNH